jgi:hypothetical protein
MSKQPAVQHEYDAKKDRLEITIKHYALKKKEIRPRESAKARAPPAREESGARKGNR